MTEGEPTAAEISSWRIQIFNAVSALGDLGFQRATWLDPEMENPAYSFVEFFECFYDASWGSYDSDNRDAPDAPFRKHINDGVLSENERDILWSVHLALKEYSADDVYAHAFILDDPVWQGVVSVASVATERLRKILTDDREIHALDNVLPSPEVKRWS
ncbi:hypothetical protein [Tsuneonella mangrovi]|uniref:hypothetical protein n=1 Tax=Tsuneonella mangrovi TaxID=1982042 RepID=UPI0012378EE9|nr:hypothetical protein [Tsuneonella mangrovi]